MHRVKLKRYIKEKYTGDSLKNYIYDGIKVRKLNHGIIINNDYFIGYGFIV